MSNTVAAMPPERSRNRYNALLQLVAGFGGLLYGVDVGIIGGALPYLEATSHLDAGQLASIVAAVLLGSVISTIFAGWLADWIGRKPMMLISGITFAVSIPLIALSHGYAPLLFGRLLQGASGGFIGVVVPLYLAECLSSSSRGKGTGVFQWLLTFGILAAALIGMYYSYRVQAVVNSHDTAAIFQIKDNAWRRIFWVSLLPGILFSVGALFISESPRWLFRQGRFEAARAALLRSRTPEEASLEFSEMESTARQTAASSHLKSSLFQRKYILPFLLACLILCCNTATGVNSIIGYNTEILVQGGLSDISAHWGYVFFTSLNFLMTIVGMLLVDRKGRRILLMIGTSGLVLSMLTAAWCARRTEAQVVDARQAVQAMVTPNQELALQFNPSQAEQLFASKAVPDAASLGHHATLVVIYSYGGFTGESAYVRSDAAGGQQLRISPADALPSNAIEAFFRNPLANLNAARNAPLLIERARLGPVPDPKLGVQLEIALLAFIAFFAMGPGVCVWLALSELMPTRIRSVGMSIALVFNQFVSTLVALIFLPMVSKHGYSTIFLVFAGTSLVYLVSVALFLPETKGKTLEEVEQYFEAA
jgi:MFS transporter, SP family, solute carrier family 2 (myo-inositol transporter), member 13